MSKNYMEQVAQMLGIDLGERFKIYNTVSPYSNSNKIYHLTKRGICDDEGVIYPTLITDILNGTQAIKKIPQRKHTGLENVAKKDEAVYILFGFRQSVSAPEPAELQTDFFTDKEIRDNWERYIDIKKRLARAASELNTAPIDWDDCRQEKWFICCHDHETLTCHYIDCGTDEGVFFTSEEAAQKAIEIIGKDDLIWMLRDFQPYLGYLAEVAEDE